MTQVVRCAIWIRFPTAGSAEDDRLARHEQENAGLGDIESRKAEDWVYAKTFCDSRDLYQTCKRTGLLEAVSAAKRGEIDLLIVHKSEHLIRSPEIATTALEVFASLGVRVFYHSAGCYEDRSGFPSNHHPDIAELERRMRANLMRISSSQTEL